MTDWHAALAFTAGIIGIGCACLAAGAAARLCADIADYLSRYNRNDDA